MRRFSVLLLTTLLLGSCNAVYNIFPFLQPATVSSDGPKGSGEAAKLVPFASRQEAEDYFNQQVREVMADTGVLEEPALAPSSDADNRGDAGAGGEAAQPSGGTDATAADESQDGSFSTTTTQEAGVDEADVVKTDGTYLYIITGGSLQIVRAAPADQLALLSVLPLEGYGREIYLDGSTVVAITESYGGYYAVDTSVDQMAAEGTDIEGLVAPTTIAPGGFSYTKPRILVTVIDASDPAAPSVTSRTAFDGSQSSSRMIDGDLYLVLANYQSYFYEDVVRLGAPISTSASDLDLDSVIPQYERTNADGNTESGPVLTWEQLFRPDEPNGYGVVAVVSMDVRNNAAFRAVGVIAEPGLIYASPEALYVTDTQWDFFGNNRTTTSIYKLEFVDGSAVPVAAGRVPGRILNQYSMGEYQGFLRVAVTKDPVFSQFGQVSQSTNAVYVLQENGGELAVVGSVENIAPRETIQSARFVGDRGFVVTFEQTDPLFTLDLSDPTNPVVVGKLEVPGFSTFIVPMDEDHLLTVGQYIPDPSSFLPWGVQLSIFNIADFARPILQDSEIIGDGDGAFSEALYNPKAFTYLAEKGIVALPVSIYDYGFIEPVFDDGGAVVVGAGGQTGSADPPSPSGQEQADGSTSTGSGPSAPVDSGDAETPPNIVDTPIDSGEPYVPGGFDGLYVYRVSADTGFSELGRVSTRFENAYYYVGSFTRGVFIGEDVYAVSDIGVRAVPVDAMDSALFEIVTQQESGNIGIGGVGVSGGAEGASGSGGTEVDSTVPEDVATGATAR